MREYLTNAILEVLWDDIVEDSQWQSAEQAKKKPDCQCKSVGYFLKKDDNYLYISSTVSGNDRSRLVIPIGVVRKVRTLR